MSDEIELEARQVPATGPLSFSDIITEFGGDIPHAFSEYFRGGRWVPFNAWGAMPRSAPMSFSQFRGAVREFRITQSGTWTNPADLRAIFNANFFDPGSVPVRLRLIVTGVIATNTPDRHALYIGQFAPGSTITIENRGQILGAGGRSNGGWGSGCIAGGYNNQEMIVENYGRLWAGGGGGGRGGQGGMGFYDNCYQVTDSLGGGAGASTNYWPNPCLKSCQALAGDAYCRSNCPDACCIGPGYRANDPEPAAWSPQPRWIAACYDCVRTYTKCDRFYTYGGGGGNGGWGIGFNNADAGAGRTGGGVPDINAGWGGAGGYGGDWGQYGQTGAAGGGGNWSGGSGGAGGGAPGPYLSAGGRVAFRDFSGDIRGRVE